jgi:hypothetical protein
MQAVCLPGFEMFNLKKNTSEMINIISWMLMHFESVCSFTKFVGNNSKQDVELEFKIETTVIFYGIKKYQARKFHQLIINKKPCRSVLNTAFIIN